MAKNKPIHVVRVGGIQLSVWANETAKGIMNTVTISKSYKVGDEFKTTQNYKGTDLPLIAIGMEEIMKFLYLKEVKTEEPDKF